MAKTINLTGPLQAAQAAAPSEPVELVLGPDTFHIAPMTGGAMLTLAKDVAGLLGDDDPTDDTMLEQLGAVTSLIEGLVVEDDRAAWSKWVETVCPTLDFLGQILGAIFSEVTGRPLPGSSSSPPPPPPTLPASTANSA